MARELEIWSDEGIIRGVRLVGDPGMIINSGEDYDPSFEDDVLEASFDEGWRELFPQFCEHCSFTLGINSYYDFSKLTYFISL